MIQWVKLVRFSSVFCLFLSIYCDLQWQVIPMGLTRSPLPGSSIYFRFSHNLQHKLTICRQFKTRLKNFSLKSLCSNVYVIETFLIKNIIVVLGVHLLFSAFAQTNRNHKYTLLIGRYNYPGRQERNTITNNNT